MSALADSGTFSTTDLPTSERFKQRRLERRNKSIGRFSPDELSPAEEAALRLEQAEADKALVAQEIARAEEQAARDAAEAAAAPAALERAAETYTKARLDAEYALAGAHFKNVPAGADIEFLGLVPALERLIPLRQEYDRAFDVAFNHGVLGDHIRIEHFAIADYLTRATTLAVNA